MPRSTIYTYFTHYLISQKSQLTHLTPAFHKNRFVINVRFFSKQNGESVFNQYHSEHDNLLSLGLTSFVRLDSSFEKDSFFSNIFINTRGPMTVLPVLINI